MILLLTTRKGKPRIRRRLLGLDKVKAARVPVPPARRTGDDEDPVTLARQEDWAFRRLRSLRGTIRDHRISMIVCADVKAHRFALELAEQHPDIPVLPDQSVAIRILAELRERGVDPSRAAVHDLLDPMRRSLPDVPQFLYDRDARPPLVVSMVQNHVEGDSRVQKVAETLAAAGYQSVLLATSPSGDPTGDWTMIGDAVVLRVPITPRLYLAQKNSPPGSVWSRIVGYHSTDAELAARNAYRRRIESLDPGSDPGFATRLRGQIFRTRSEYFWRTKKSFHNAEHRRSEHTRRASRLMSRFSRTDPEDAYRLIDDMEAAFAPVLEELKPAAIHVHDPMLLGMAFRASRRLARLDCEPQIVFDAHEWTAGVQRQHAYHAAALVRLERQYLPKVADTITVSDEIADKMTSEFGLADRPTVVENAPKAEIDTEFGDIRTAAGVPDGAPLLVYVGGLAERRGVLDAVAALRHLPDAHLVLLSPPGPRVKPLREMAREIGAASRLHRLDYVPADKVTGYIRTADVGLIPFRPLLNSELGVPTKFREYLLAGLPIVATDLGATAAELRRTGVGELCAHSRPKSLAKAVRKVLADPAAYTAKITDDLRGRNTWEAQSTALVNVYERLIGAPGEPVRGHDVLIGATNSAGQAHEWARALRGAGVDAGSLELRLAENSFTHRVDRAIPRQSLSTLDRRIQLLLGVVAPHRALIMESGRSMAAPEPGEVDARVQGFREARALRDSGRNVGLIFHGSDIRRPDVHRRTHPWSPFDDPRAEALTRELRKRTGVVHQNLATWDGPVMVSTPDLIHASPGVVWTPVVVDLDMFPYAERAESDPESRPPVVLHMPSRSLLKGSHLIDPILRQLAREGVIQYRRIERVPHETVPALLAECDIFVDQLGMGIFGVAPLEAMATGAAVVTDPGPEALQAYGEEVPIVPVDPDTMATAIRELAGDYERRRQLAKSGRDFVVRHHDGRRSAEAIIAAMGLSV